MKNITVRRSTSGDESALARLAALDSAKPPRGPALVAEADSRMLAALPLGAGRAIADPFEPTAAAVALLALRRAPRRMASRGAAPAVSADCSASPETPEGLQPNPSPRTAPANSLRPAPFRCQVGTSPGTPAATRRSTKRVRIG